MDYRPSKKLVVSLTFHKIFFVLITILSLLISFTAKSQKQPAQKTLNDIRNKDLEILDLWNKYHEACVAHAMCKGTDTRECDQPVLKQ